MIILKSRVTATFRTSLEVEVEVFSESITTGERKLTSHAFLTFVALDVEGKPKLVPPLLIESPEDEERNRQALARRAERLARRGSVISDQ
jgi:acyl-CoA hydrolase